MNPSYPSSAAQLNMRQNRMMPPPGVAPQQGQPQVAGGGAAAPGATPAPAGAQMTRPQQPPPGMAMRGPMGNGQNPPQGQPPQGQMPQGQPQRDRMGQGQPPQGQAPQGQMPRGQGQMQSMPGQGGGQMAGGMSQRMPRGMMPPPGGGMISQSSPGQDQANFQRQQSGGANLQTAGRPAIPNRRPTATA